MQFKKLLMLGLISVMSMSLLACGNKEKEPVEDTQQEVVVEDETQEETTDDAETEETPEGEEVQTKSLKQQRQ